VRLGGAFLSDRSGDVVGSGKAGEPSRTPRAADRGLDIEAAELERDLAATRRRVLQAIAAGERLGGVLDDLIRDAERASGGMLGSILLIDDDGVHVRHGAAPSLPPEYVRAIDGEPIGPAAGSCGTAAWRREQVVVEDIATDPLWAGYREIALACGLRACWSTPIFDADRSVLGTFALYYPQPRSPDARHRTIIAGVTDLAALAIGRDRADRQRRRSLNEAEAARGEATAARERLAAVFARISDGVIALDREWRYTYVNEQAALLLNRRSPADLLGRHIWEEYPEGVDQPFARAYRRAMEEQRPVTVEEYYEPWDRWFENRVYPSRDGLTIYFSEISARKRAEKALRDSECRLRNLFEQAADGIFVLTPDHRYVDANAAGLRMLGYSREELLGTSLHEVLVEREHERLDPEVAAMMAGTPHLEEWEHRRKDGTTFPAEVSARPISGAEYLAIVRDLTPRRAAEAAVREGEIRARAAVQAGNVGLWDWDLQSGRVQFSAEWKRQIGYQPEEIGDDFSEWERRVHPDDLAGATAAVRAFLSDPRPGFHNEFRFRHKDGSYRWILAQADLVRDDEGRPARMVGTHVDVTERRLAEEGLRESERRMRLFVEHSPAAIAMFDCDMVYLIASRRWLSDYGIAGRDIVGRSHYEVFPDLPERWKQIHRRCLAGEVASSARDPFPRADGRLDWVRWEIRPWLRADGVIGGLIIFSEVITDRVEAELELEEKERLLAESQRIAHLGSWLWELEPERLSWTPEAFRIFGLEESAPAPTPEAFFAAVHEADLPAVRTWLDDGRAGHEIGELVFRIVRPDGDVRHVGGRCRRESGAEGSTGRLVGVFQDVTERIRMEDDLRAWNVELEGRVTERTAELEARNRALETFTYSVSHDLKAPLRGLDGYSRLLLEDHAERLDEEGRRFLQTIRGAAQQMSRLIDDLLAYSRLERRAVQAGLVSLRPLVDALLAERGDEIRTRSVDVRVTVPDLVVHADADGLALALRNLIDNALKFARDSSPPQLTITALDRGDRAVLGVGDNGIGFEMRFHDRIFDIFQRLHPGEEYPGTGIGLAIVHKAMERMGGRAWAESEPGRGATFFLEIPR
jgi:PAS domain S-box-containing protein